MKRRVVIVQARVGSSRLPGKVLLDLAGKTVLRHVLERCIAIEGASRVCCAIPTGSSDDAVAEEAMRCGAGVVRGSETDVLDRYYRAALEYEADVVVRVTSDCPVLDPYVAGRVLKLVTEAGADYACNNLPRTWPHGLDCEAFRFGWLERAAREAYLPYDREHVTPFMRNHPESRKLNLPGPGAEAARHRWTLDTADDLEFLRGLFARLPAGPAGFDFRLPLSIVEKEPELAAVNRVAP